MADPKQPNEQDQSDLVAYLDGELDAESARKVEARMNSDPKVRAEADALRMTWDLLDYLPRPEPSPNFTHRTLSRMSLVPGASTGPKTAPPRRQSWLLGVCWIGAVILAGAAGFVGMGWLKLAPVPPPPVETISTTGPLTAEQEQQLIRDLRAIERLRLYRKVNDIYFLNELDRPDLFGDEDQPGGANP